MTHDTTRLERLDVLISFGAIPEVSDSALLSKSHDCLDLLILVAFPFARILACVESCRDKSALESRQVHQKQPLLGPSHHIVWYVISERCLSDVDARDAGILPSSSFQDATVAQNPIPSALVHTAHPWLVFAQFPQLLSRTSVGV
jgi:hypothetical protein